MPHKRNVIRTVFRKDRRKYQNEASKPHNPILSFPIRRSKSNGCCKRYRRIPLNIYMAINYLTGKYDSHVGLLYESEDNGTHWLGSWATYRNTYWLYSDNLEALHVLKKFNPVIAENISKTYDRYEFPKKTLLFGTLFGENIPDEIKDVLKI